MKKIFLGLALGLAALSSAQQYPNNGWGDDGYYQNGNGNGDGYYNDEDDRNYFPDDYYYNYPQDYYPNDYYQGYYNDYRNSIVNINWNVFFRDNRLNQWQIDQVLRLNNLYVSFSTWNNFYRYNPDRWYYDRFYALQRILGPRVFVVFQNNYYRGISPVVYFQNYRRTYYAPRYAVMPRYRNININVYRVDRARFRRMDNPTFNIVRTSNRPNNGFRNSAREGNAGGFRGQAGNNGFRNDNNGVRNNGGFRGNSENNGTRGGFGSNGGFRGSSNEANRERTPQRENNSGGFRGNSGGFRSENSSSRSQNNHSSENKSGGFRSRLASNR